MIALQSALVLRTFEAQRKCLVVTTKAKKPDIQSPIYMEILRETQSTMGAVSDIREANRASPLFNHLSTVSEGIAMLGWITIDPKPADYVTETLGSAQFYGNRVLKEYKDKSRQPIPAKLLIVTNVSTEIIRTLNGFRRFIVFSTRLLHTSNSTTQQV